MESKIKTCPSCEEKALKIVISDISRLYNGKTIIIPDVQYEKCSNCGEELYDGEAIDKIDSYLGLSDSSSLVIST